MVWSPPILQTQKRQREDYPEVACTGHLCWPVSPHTTMGTSQHPAWLWFTRMSPVSWRRKGAMWKKGPKTERVTVIWAWESKNGIVLLPTETHEEGLSPPHPVFSTSPARAICAEIQQCQLHPSATSRTLPGPDPPGPGPDEQYQVPLLLQ